MAIPKIESYYFVEIVINRRRYSSDVQNYPDRIEDQWLRREGHSLVPSDVGESLQGPPEVLVIGQRRVSRLDGPRFKWRRKY